MESVAPTCLRLFTETVEGGEMSGGHAETWYSKEKCYFCKNHQTQMRYIKMGYWVCDDCILEALKSALSYKLTKEERYARPSNEDEENRAGLAQ